MLLSPVTNKPYRNDAIIGNSSMLAALGANGELYRLWWPHLDIPQHIERMRIGIWLDEQQQTIWLDDPDSWHHQQRYIDQTNVLRSTATGMRLPLQVTTTDFVSSECDLLVRHYELTNTGTAEMEIRFVCYASLTIGENRFYNTVTYDSQVDGLVFFRHTYSFALASANVCTGYTCGDALPQAAAGDLIGNRIAMASDGAICWELSIQPGQTVSLPLYLTAGHSIAEAIRKMRVAKERPVQQWLAATTDHWRQFLQQLPSLPLADERIRRLYERSILVFALVSDKQSGSIIAAPEFDEAFTRCGGYAFCWGRDAAYIATAFDRAGLSAMSRSFYRWTLLAQDPDGSWQQRHYHDGRLAPSWGLQIDEGGSILWGMHQHYLSTHDHTFLSEIWPAVEKGAAFLLTRLDPQTGLPLPTCDLWEERVASHTYSAAAVWAGLRSAAAIARELQKQSQVQLWSEAAERLKAAILSQTVNQRTGTFYRGRRLVVDYPTYLRAREAGQPVECETDEKGYTTYFIEYDEVMDISLLGLTVPFGLLPADDPRMSATADAIELTCTSPFVGGIRRYQDDSYIGGNPWILTTLWLAQFRIKQGRFSEARQHLEWAIAHSTSLDLLPEQVDRQSGEPAWVIPLTWSHAMYVLTVHMLHDAGEL
ncbi:glycoside hydrolase family 15 protein [Brevibacillus humidisoli]|uniref:glycoside hydrolase family 15 protein n=1 Tax=Brevibacillus humidisoli TaxID=2895522 RepID=UPI001E57F8A1|nr:glycoside hydrolase family 15 protein [Brevibacillus humidisoli]UFJ39400.1 glycoside hydrolase family 15 protein [Brevibacillus humidisoli]